MSERIRVDWEQMEDTAVQLKRLSDLLNSVSSRIRGVRIDQRSGAELELSFSAGRLSSTGTTIGCGTVEECLKSLSAGVGALNEHTASLSGRIEQAANLFADNEKRLAHSFGTILTPGGSYEPDRRQHGLWNGSRCVDARNAQLASKADGGRAAAA